VKTLSIVSLLVFLQFQAVHAALKTHTPAPDFSLFDGENKAFTLSTALGRRSPEKHRGVVLSFFASWCPPCRIELPILGGMTDALRKKGILVVLVGVKEDHARIGALLSELQIAGPIVLSDGDGAVARQYEVKFLPTTFFIASDGTLRDVLFGGIKDDRELTKSIDRLLKE
jgi:thiol-disulfide isomerase/thioredoxin